MFDLMKSEKCVSYKLGSIVCDNLFGESKLQKKVFIIIATVAVHSGIVLLQSILHEYILSPTLTILLFLQM